MITIVKNQIDFRSLYDRCLAGILLTDKALSVIEANNASCQLLGYGSIEEIKHTSLSSHHIDTAHQELFDFYVEKSLTKGKSLVLDYAVNNSSGDTIWLSISGIALDKGNHPDLDKGIVWTLVDISSRKAVEEQLTKQSNTDFLTGVSNRRHFLLSAEGHISSHFRKERTLSVLMLDIDHFKSINDNFGHSTGDDAIKMLAGICNRILRKEDLLGRLGGEEFSMLLAETNLEQAMLVAERLRLEIEEQSLKRHGPSMTVSIGVAELREKDSIDTLLSRADGALYVAKHRGRNQVVEVS